MSSGGVGQLYPQGWERQGFATSVVGHCDGLEMGERGAGAARYLGGLVCWSGDVA